MRVICMIKNLCLSFMVVDYVREYMSAGKLVEDIRIIRPDFNNYIAVFIIHRDSSCSTHVF